MGNFFASRYSVDDVGSLPVILFGACTAPSNSSGLSFWCCGKVLTTDLPQTATVSEAKAFLAKALKVQSSKIRIQGGTNESDQVVVARNIWNVVVRDDACVHACAEKGHLLPTCVTAADGLMLFGVVEDCIGPLDAFDVAATSTSRALSRPIGGQSKIGQTTIEFHDTEVLVAAQDGEKINIITSFKFNFGQASKESIVLELRCCVAGALQRSPGSQLPSGMQCEMLVRHLDGSWHPVKNAGDLVHPDCTNIVRGEIVHPFDIPASDIVVDHNVELRLGTGSSAHVWPAVVRDSSRVAAKEYRVFHRKNFAAPVDVQNAIRKWNSRIEELRKALPTHENVLRPLGVVKESYSRGEVTFEGVPKYIIYEQCDMNFSSFLNIHAGKLHETGDRIFHILRDTVRGLLCLHSNGIVHATFNSRDILLKGPRRVMISALSDLDSSSTSTITESSVRLLIAPEVDQVACCTPAADMWSFGMVLAEVLDAAQGGTLVDDVASVSSSQEAVDKTLAARNVVKTSFLARLLSVDPKLRPTAAEVADLMEQC